MPIVNRPMGRNHLAALSAAAVVGATAAGAAAGVAHAESEDTSTVASQATQDSVTEQVDPGKSADSVALADQATQADPVSLDEAPEPVAVDAQLIRSVARQVLLEQERPEHLTNVDLIARDVLAQGPADPAQAEYMTRETMLGFGPGAPVADAPESEVVMAPPQCPPTARACIDVDGKMAWMVEDGRVTYGPVPITTGKPGYETARGTHNVLRHVRHDHSIPFDSPMPYSTYFTVSGMAFHEGRLDEPSHGCVHLGQQAAAHFFEHLKVGDEIVAF